MSLQTEMSSPDNILTGAARSGFSTSGFVIFMATAISIVAFSTDIMLSALPLIGKEFQVLNPNDPQFVLISFILAFGVSQLFFGPITDCFGRKPILIGGLISFTISSILAIFSPDFTWLLIARIIQGISAGAVRTSSSATIRDCFSGADMARVTSYIFATFMIAPIVAPIIGQGIIFIANWHWIFLFLGCGGALTTIWAQITFKETHSPENRRPLSLKRIRLGLKEILSSRLAMGYTIISFLMVSILFSFVFSAAQLLGELYAMGDKFIIVFALTAASMALASITNGKLVKTVPIRKLVHCSMILFLIVSIVFFTCAFLDNLPLWAMALTMMMTMSLFGFISTNSISIAMEPMGHIAGTASSLINTLTVTGGATVGGIVGQLYNDTLMPMATTYVVIAALGVIVILKTERGNLLLKAE